MLETRWQVWNFRCKNSITRVVGSIANGSGYNGNVARIEISHGQVTNLTRGIKQVAQGLTMGKPHEFSRGHVGTLIGKKLDFAARHGVDQIWQGTIGKDLRRRNDASGHIIGEDGRLDQWRVVLGILVDQENVLSDWKVFLNESPVKEIGLQKQ